MMKFFFVYFEEYFVNINGNKYSMSIHLCE